MTDDTPSYRAEPDGEFASRLERELLDRLAAPPSTPPADPADGTLAVVEFSDDDWQPSEPPFVVGRPEPESDPRTNGSPWLVVAAAAAVVVLAVAGALAFTSRVHTTHSVPARVTSTTTRPRVTTDPAAQVEVADSFMEAWDAGDADGAVDLFGNPMLPEGSNYVQVNLGGIDDNSYGRPAIDDLAALPPLHDWFRAIGWEQRREPCRPVGPDMPEVADSSSVVCNSTYENDLTRAVGRQPVPQQFSFMVVGDEIVTIHGGLFDLDADIWQMFGDWVLDKHPDDITAMYNPSTPPTPRLDEASIALWERHVEEFVASPLAHAPPSTEAPTRAQFGAKARMICATAAFEGLWWSMEWLKSASQNAMEQLRGLSRPEEEAAQIDQLFSLLEEYNRAVVEDRWFHNDSFYDVQDEKNALGGFDFWGCPVGPLGG